MPTELIVYSDDEFLNVLFHARDDEIVASHLQHDAPLYEEDVVEVFLAPKELIRYFEIEVNPLGTTFDARIDSPQGTRAGIRIDVGWDCANLFAAVRKMGDIIDTMIRIPFASLDASRPATGEEWRGNFFRIDHARNGTEYSAWQPTLKNPADFHVAAAFGRLRFE
jgi:cellulose/xylan binding protein with CBM9 domain